ncbi:uncharacterized protein MELLADRAFT_87154 [Melampsora larici-populina 98AG31]|uniref:Uncharacterized protein n=1 Tax=Melampsora larici-populina (strain 98AG31 / pathotype 3-4-7) TaxID=747676 RepID=F4R4Q3_MELLP|nr:uncharacterized protein MELLADRAFT_87154 [Melampsora larici-populina 98AG31]EGG12848.1 hypothetical protein MELLADRAFT_87154 [Melampsora larici-populina 98AG31]
MSNTSSIAPAETPLTGHMNPLFKTPVEWAGDERVASCIRQDPLHCVGTPARDNFEKNNQMTIEVRFKIYTDMEVDLNAANQSTPKVGAGKKAAKSAKLNLIDSRAINSQYLKLKICLFGKSLIEFEDLVAGACEVYEAGMKKIILNSSFLPDLKWKATLEKSTKKMGVVSIENENVQVKAKDGNKALATKKLIAATNGGGAEDQESEESKQERELKTLANQIFSQHEIDKGTKGPGWPPTLPPPIYLQTPWSSGTKSRRINGSTLTWGGITVSNFD